METARKLWTVRQITSAGGRARWAGVSTEQRRRLMSRARRKGLRKKVARRRMNTGKHSP